MSSPLKGLLGAFLLFQMILLRAVTRDIKMQTGDQRGRRRLLPQLPQLAPDLSALMPRSASTMNGTPPPTSPLAFNKYDGRIWSDDERIMRLNNLATRMMD